MYGAGDVRVREVPDPAIKEPTDAIVRIVRSCVCGSDLHRYHTMEKNAEGVPMGHEFIGVVEETGGDVTTVRRGDFVIAPFVYSDGTCAFCREELYTSCVHGSAFGGAQAEAVRVPFADGTLVASPTRDPALLPSLLTLSDVYSTGYHAAVTGGVTRGTTVTVIGDGAVGLLAVLSARRLGAERIVLMGRHKARTDLGVEFGATDVVAARGEEGIARVRDLTGGQGTHVVLEAVGHLPAYEQAVGVVRAGGTISRVGVPQYDQAPTRWMFHPNVTLTGGVAPARKYIPELLPGVLDGTVDPGRVFDSTVGIDDVPAGYEAMDRRTALKVMIAF
jgi:threonine dehydrogenase-like Zn-dependent dehydrogenase